jgi:transcriptional regulator with XRE-family HTH domain
MGAFFGDNVSMAFWDAVKAEMKRQGLKQDWIAQKAGIDPGTFRSALSKENDPQFSRAIAIANALGVPLDALADRETDPWMTRYAEFVADCRALPEERLAPIVRMAHLEAADYRASAEAAAALKRQTSNF